MEKPGMQQIPMDVIAGIVFKQTVELEVLRGQLAQAKQANAAANARILEMGKAAEEMEDTISKLSDVNSQLEGLQNDVDGLS